MPRNDQTGPEGFGPMTGRRMGICVGNQKRESFLNRRMGGGFGGRNRRRYFSEEAGDVNLSKDAITEEIKNLKTRLIFLENELEKKS